eukprot:5831061-Ditylum_brightwellii.AAC.1
MLPLGDSLERATVVSRERDANGLPIGLANNNPLLGTWMYEVRFNDDTVDSEGNEHILLANILDHQKDNSAVEKEDMHTTGSGSKNKHKHQTTKGWKLL